MVTINIDHKTLESYYTQSDVITACLYDKNKLSNGELIFKSGDDDLMLQIFDPNYIIIAFNIKSENICTGRVHINNAPISLFHVSRGTKIYPHLIMICANFVTLTLNKHYVTEVKILKISLSKCSIMYDYLLPRDNRAHRIIKVNNFSPNIVYTNLKLCGYKFVGGSCSHSWGSYGHKFVSDLCTIGITCDVNGCHDSNNVDNLVIATKINAISKRIIQLLNFDCNLIVKDILICVGIVMYYLV